MVSPTSVCKEAQEMFEEESGRELDEDSTALLRERLLRVELIECGLD